MSRVLENKTALVTGGSRGIGRAIACRLARSGALVAINYANDISAGEETARIITDEGGRAILLRRELGSRDAAQALAVALFEQLAARTGEAALDILVNNVGGTPYANLEATTPEIYDRVLTNNVGATFWTTQAMVGRMRQNGRIVNISSAASRLALPPLLVYSMAKAAIDNFTRALAKELGGRGITVNSVLPGTTATDATIADLATDEARAWLASRTSLGRASGEPMEIAELVHALVTPELGWVTGQTIEASGGFEP